MLDGNFSRIYGHSKETERTAKSATYHRFASVLLAVLDAERRDASFSPVREGLEQRFFPPTFTEGASQLEAVRQAMKNLTELIQPEGQPEPMSWAIRWLSDAGIQQDNPAVLMMFAIRWPNHFAAALEALRKFKPVI
ncbi:MAG TPA: hypothetical protein VG077_11975 [Verrucomicrobiae bacterium]|nr:hypothetical protein [Verrucomicrobiae bacterium]